MNIGDIFVRFLGDTKDVDRAIDATARGAQGQGRTIGNALATNIQRGTTVAGAAVGTFFVGAVGAATNFQDQLKTIQTVVPDVNLDKVGADILALSKETGKTTDDLTSGFYDLVSAGVDADAAIGVLRDSAKFATGALGTTAESVDLVTSVMNAYGLEATDSARITDVFAKAVADGKVTAAELGGSIAQIAPVAAAAGISMEEVSAGFALLTAKGAPASAAATQMRAAISALLTPNEALNRIQAQTGINFADLAREKGLGVALETLRAATAETGGEFDKLASAVFETEQRVASGKASSAEYADVIGEFRDNLGLTEAQAKAFTAAIGSKGAGQALADLGKKLGASDQGFAGALGSIDAYQLALATTGENASEFGAEIQSVLGSAGTAQEQYDIKSSSAAEGGKRMVAQLRATAIQLGGPFVEAFGPAIGALGGLSTGMTGIFNLSRLVGGGLGAIAGKLIGVLIPGILSTAAPAAVAGQTVGAATAGGISLGAVLLPALLIAAVVAAIIAVVNNPELVGQALDIGRKVIEAIVGAVVSFGRTLIQRFAEIFANVSGAIGPAIGTIVDLIVGIPARVIGWVAGLVGQAGEAIAGVVGAIGSGVGTVVGLYLSIPGRIIGWVGSIVGQAGSIASGVVSSVTGFAGSVVSTVLAIPGRLVAWVGSIIGQAGQIAVRVVGTVAQLHLDVARFFLAIPGKILSWVGSIGGQAVSMAGRVVGTVSKLVGDVVSWFLGIPAKIASLGGSIVSGIISGMASLPGQLADTIGSAFANLRIDVGPFHISGSGVSIDLPKIELPSFDVGSNFIPADMLAMVHKGEIIVPADDAEDVRAGRASIGGAPRGGGGADGLTVNVYNPTPEPASTSTKRELRKLQVTGAVR